MLSILIAGGWVMVPLVICSVFAMAIIIERSWKLRYNKVVPAGLNETIIFDLKNKTLSQEKLNEIQNSSPLGQLLIVAITNIKKERAVILHELENTGRNIIHNLESNLNLLATIAAVSPLLGLLGTVIGMIQVFSVITESGIGNPNTMAGGIATALITTAAGLVIAIPSLVCYRTFQRRLDEIAFRMQQESVKLVDSIKDRIK